jgi:hypothetical protein
MSAGLVRRAPPCALVVHFRGVGPAQGTDGPIRQPAWKATTRRGRIGLRGAVVTIPDTLPELEDVIAEHPPTVFALSQRFADIPAIAALRADQRSRLGDVWC